MVRQSDGLSVERGRYNRYKMKTLLKLLGEIDHSLIDRKGNMFNVDER